MEGPLASVTHPQGGWAGRFSYTPTSLTQVPPEARGANQRPTPAHLDFLNYRVDQACGGGASAPLALTPARLAAPLPRPPSGRSPATRPRSLVLYSMSFYSRCVLGVHGKGQSDGQTAGDSRERAQVVSKC